jgi:hypothetical protein
MTLMAAAMAEPRQERILCNAAWFLLDHAVSMSTV